MWALCSGPAQLLSGAHMSVASTASAQTAGPLHLGSSSSRPAQTYSQGAGSLPSAREKLQGFLSLNLDSQLHFHYILLVKASQQYYVNLRGELTLQFLILWAAKNLWLFLQFTTNVFWFWGTIYQWVLRVRVGVLPYMKRIPPTHLLNFTFSP